MKEKMCPDCANVVSVKDAICTLCGFRFIKDESNHSHKRKKQGDRKQREDSLEV